MYAGSLVAVVAVPTPISRRLRPSRAGDGESPTASVAPWTDDFSNILAAIWRLKVGK